MVIIFMFWFSIFVFSSILLFSIHLLSYAFSWSSVLEFRSDFCLHMYTLAEQGTEMVYVL